MIAVLVRSADWKTELKLEIQKALDAEGGSVAAENPVELMIALGFRNVPRCRFKSALGSLMYKDRIVTRTHVFGCRHYELLR